MLHIDLRLRSYGHWLETSKSVKWQPSTQSYRTENHLLSQTILSQKKKFYIFPYIAVSESRIWESERFRFF